MYDATTKQTADRGLQGPLAAILVYSDPGQHVMPADSGPLRFMIADQQNENAMMTGSDSIKNVSRLNVVDATLKEWQLKLVGLKKNGAKPTRDVHAQQRSRAARRRAATGPSFTVSGQAVDRHAALPAHGRGRRRQGHDLQRASWRARATASGCTRRAASRSPSARRSPSGAARSWSPTASTGPRLGDLFYPLRLVGPPQVRAGQQASRSHHQDRDAADEAVTAS